MAPKAALRPFQIRALCSGEVAASITFGWNALAISTMSPSSRLTSSGEALDLDDQQRLDVERVAGLGVGLADGDRRLVHELDGDGDDARRDDGGDALPRGLLVVKPSMIGRALSAFGRMRSVASVMMPNWPSEPTMSARKS